MKATDLMIGDWVYYKYSAPEPWQPRQWRIVAFFGGNFIELSDPGTSCKPIPLTPEILEKNGWRYKKPNWVLKEGVIRLGWNPESLKFHLGYGELPVPVSNVHEIQHIYRICGMDERADNFII